MKDYLTAKYELYIDNLEWHLKTNKEDECVICIIQALIDAYKEMLTDLKML